MEIAETLLNRGGIICLDDFFSVRYPQITKACFDYMLTNPGKLNMFLVGFNKAFLCRPSGYKSYMTYIVEFLQKDLLKRGCKSTLIKTGFTGELAPYGIRGDDNSPKTIGPDWDSKNIDFLA